MLDGPQVALLLPAAVLGLERCHDAAEVRQLRRVHPSSFTGRGDPELAQVLDGPQVVLVRQPDASSIEHRAGAAPVLPELDGLDDAASWAPRGQARAAQA